MSESITMNQPTTRTPWAALLRLELANLGNWRRLLTFAVILLVVFAFLGGVTFAAPMLGIFAVTVALTPWTADENCRLPLLYGSLPLRRRWVVASHFAFGALATLVMAPAMTLVTLLTAVLFPSPEAPGAAEMISTTLVALVAVALLPPVMAPVRIRFGQQTSAFVMMGLFALITAGAIAFVSAGGLTSDAGWPLFTDPSGGLWILLGIETAVCVLAWVVSYLICVRLYEAKDV